jgi:Mitochondrial carrier protein
VWLLALLLLLPQGLLRDGDGRLSDAGRLAAGAAAGVTEALVVVTPFEVVKIRLQQQRGLTKSQLKYHVRARCAVAAAATMYALWPPHTHTHTHRGCRSSLCHSKLAAAQMRLPACLPACLPATHACHHTQTHTPAPPPTHKHTHHNAHTIAAQNPVHCAITILREEGLRGMWSGASPTMMRNGTNQMCLFWAKNNVDRYLWGKTEGDGRQLTAAQSMVSGFTAAFMGPIATGEAEPGADTQQHAAHEADQPLACAPYHAAPPCEPFHLHPPFASLPQLMYSNHMHTSITSNAHPPTSGPMDVIKTRLMAQGKEGSGGVRYKGLLDALVTIPRQEGLRALWKGLLPRLMRIPPGQAIVWAVSDQITGFFEMQELKKHPELLAAKRASIAAASKS